MSDTLTVRDLVETPEIASKPHTLRSGEEVALRPLRAADAVELGRYFLGLSEATRAVYAPHPFDQATADKVCVEIDNSQCIRMIAMTAKDGAERIIAYFIFVLGVREGDLKRYAEHGMTIDTAATCTLGPSVADAYQEQGLGSAIMGHLIDLARRLGRRHVILMGGVREDNRRAVHFYTKSGFRKLWEFRTSVNNYDMMMDL